MSTDPNTHTLTLSENPCQRSLYQTTSGMWCQKNIWPYKFVMLNHYHWSFLLKRLVIFNFTIFRQFYLNNRKLIAFHFTTVMPLFYLFIYLFRLFGALRSMTSGIRDLMIPRDNSLISSPVSTSNLGVTIHNHTSEHSPLLLLNIDLPAAFTSRCSWCCWFWCSGDQVLKTKLYTERLIWGS